MADEAITLLRSSVMPLLMLASSFDRGFGVSRGHSRWLFSMSIEFMPLVLSITIGLEASQ